VSEYVTYNRKHYKKPCKKFVCVHNLFNLLQQCTKPITTTQKFYTKSHRGPIQNSLYKTYVYKIAFKARFCFNWGPLVLSIYFVDERAWSGAEEKRIWIKYTSTPTHPSFHILYTKIVVQKYVKNHVSHP
jgi:hypothetical protein